MRPQLSSGLLALTLAASGAWGAVEPSLFEEGSHCVAYRVQNTMFFFKTDTVTGKNCEVSAQVLPEVGGLYLIEVNIPIRGFNSDDSERDKDVMKILKADERPEMTFKSMSHSVEKWREMFAKSSFELAGELFIGDKSYPVKLNSRYIQRDDSSEIDGQGSVRFQDLGLTPPTVGGGVLARVKPDLELHFHFTSQRILGADSIRPVTLAAPKITVPVKVDSRKGD